MRTWISLIVVGSMLLGQYGYSSGNWYTEDIWKNEDRAFQWYPDERKPRKKEQLKQTPTAQPGQELLQFEQLQKQLDVARKTAIMNPTEANLKRYIEIQEVAMSKSAAFTDQWQRVIWQNPQLDYSQHGRPTNQLASQAYDQVRQGQKADAIRKLAAENGILFIFRSDCPYCHAMAPIMKQFSADYGVNVMPVSLDGAGIDYFPSPLPNNGIAQRLGVQSVPAIYVMDTRTKQFKAVGFGVISQTTLEDRFLALSRPVGTVY